MAVRGLFHAPATLPRYTFIGGCVSSQYTTTVTRLHSRPMFCNITIQHSRPMPCNIKIQHSRPMPCNITIQHSRPMLCNITIQHSRPTPCNIMTQHSRPTPCNIMTQHYLPKRRQLFTPTHSVTCHTMLIFSNTAVRATDKEVIVKYRLNTDTQHCSISAYPTLWVAKPAV